MDRQKDFKWNSGYAYPDLDEYRYYQISIRIVEADIKLELFPSTREAYYYLNHLYWQLSKRGIKLIAYCMMPEHIHMIVQTPEWTSLTTAIRMVNIAYSVHIKAMARKTRLPKAIKEHSLLQYLRKCPKTPIFQKHCSYVPIKGYSHILEELRYVGLNPDRAHIPCPKSLISSRREYRRNYFEYLDQEAIVAVAKLFGRQPKELHRYTLMDDPTWTEHGHELIPQDISDEQEVFKHPGAKYKVHTFRLPEEHHSRASH